MENQTGDQLLQVLAMATKPVSASFYVSYQCKNELCDAVWWMNAAHVPVHCWRALRPVEMRIAVENLASPGWCRHHTLTVLHRRTLPSTASRRSHQTRTCVLRRLATQHIPSLITEAVRLDDNCYHLSSPWLFSPKADRQPLCKLCEVYLKIVLLDQTNAEIVILLCKTELT